MGLWRVQQDKVWAYLRYWEGRAVIRGGVNCCSRSVWKTERGRPEKAN
jgi:hypothetical protein